jgi:hypothetical protein
MTRLSAAWDALHAAMPSGWQVGRPSEHPERDEWVLYAFDSRERPVAGVRSREWLAKASTEVDVVREMARCLAEIRAGRTPK